MRLLQLCCKLNVYGSFLSWLCRCDVLKLAMIKNQFVAEKLFNGNVYDCMCKYEAASGHPPESSHSK